MNKLKNLFVLNSGGYIHIGIWVVMVMISYHHPITLFFLILDSIFLFKHYRFIFFLGLLLSVIITVRYLDDDNHEPIPFSIDEYAYVMDVHQNQYTVKQNGYRYYLYTNNDDSLKPGDTIRIEGYLFYQDGYVIDHVFDYSQYLKANRIEGSVYATDVERLSESFHINCFKYQVRKSLEASLDGKTFSYIALILLGDDSFLSESTHNAIQSLNINHLFAVSGMHVAVLCSLFNHVISFFHLRKRTQKKVLIVFLLGYAYLCGFTPSIVRAASMVGLWLLNGEINMPFSKLDLLTFLMVLFLIINPFSIHLLSFQLSFLMSYIIVLGQPIIHDESAVISLSKLTIIAFVFGFPFFLETNGRFHLLAIPVGILFSWLVTHFLMPAILIVTIIPSFHNLFHWAIDAFEWLLSILADERMQIAFNFSSDTAKFLYWLGLFFFFLRKKSVKSRISGTLVLLSSFLISLSWIQITHYTSVSILDVGNGDSIHIQSGQNHCLIDTGSTDDMDRLITYFKRRNIDDLDTIFVTHRHEDHIGELDDLFKELTISRYVGHFNDGVPLYTEQIMPKINDVFMCGDMSLQVVFFDTTNDNENNNSLVLLGTIYNQKWLFTGDIEYEVERQLISTQMETVTYLKVPHHGSNTSSTMSFISKLNPKIAIISVGKHNAYDHPSEEVISRYQLLETIIYRTDDEGTVTFHFYRPFAFALVTNEAQKRKPYGYLIQGFNFWVWMFGK